MMLLLNVLNALHWFSGFGLLVLAGFCLTYRKKSIARALALFLFLAASWALLAAIIYQVPDLATKIMLNRIKLISSALLPLSIFYLGIQIHSDLKIPKWVWPLSLVVPLITVTILLSPYHHLMISNYQIIEYAGGKILKFSNGPWFVFHYIMTKFLIIVMLIFLYMKMKTIHPFHRTKNWVIIVAVITPFLVDVLGVYFFDIFRYTQMVPAVLPFTEVAIIYSIYGYKALDIVPFTRAEIVKHMPDPCMMWDPEQRLIDYNQSATNILDLNEKCIGKNVQTIFSNNDQLKKLLSIKNENLKILGEYQTPDNMVYEIIHQVVAAGSFTIFKDITSQKRIESEWRHIDQVKSTFMGILAHDLAGNVSNIALLSEILARDQKNLLAEDIHSISESIYHSAEEVNNFISELLQWAKSQSTTLNVNKEVIHLDSHIKKVVEFLRPLAIEKNHDINLHFPVIEQVSADPRMIETIMRNLLSNAIKYSPEDAPITIGYEKINNSLEVYMKNLWADNFNHQKINSFLVHDEILSNKDTVGLGLLLCREFVTLHKGKIWVETNEVSIGKEAIFRFSLPLEIS